MAIICKSLLLIVLGESVLGFAQQSPSNLQSLFAAAQQAQVSGDYATAISDYAQAAKMRPEMPIIWANLGLSQQEAGDIPAAIDSFQRANHLDPSLYVPNLFLGIDYAHSGKATQAVPFLVKAEKTDPADAQAPLALGRAYLSAREYNQSIPQLERALKLNPDLGAAWFDLGIAQLDQVEADARTISEQNKQSPFAGALYAESLVKQARFGEAAKLYQSLLDMQPQPPCLQSELGFALIREHDKGGAEAAFAKERSTHPECSLALLGQARLALDNSDTNQAFSLLGQVMDRDHGFLACKAVTILDGMPSDEQTAFLSKLTSESAPSISPSQRQALLAAFNTQDDCSVQSSNDAVASEQDRSAQEDYASGQFAACARRLQANPQPLSTDRLRLLAACSWFTGDNKSAAHAATALRKLEPHSAEALYWSIQSNERLAFESLARFQQLEPDSARSHVLLGDIYQQLERYDNAQSEYQKALSASPSDLAATLGLASAYLSNYNPQGAMTLAQKALAHTPDDSELNLIMGQALLDQREFDQALPYLQKSLTAKPQMLPRIHALIGKAYAETGKTKEAIEELNLGASSDEDGSVQYLLFRLYHQIGDTKNAQAALVRMETIKHQREARGVKHVEDPDLSPIEQVSNNSATP